MKLNCIAAATLSAFIIAAAVFLGEVGHTEYKSIMRKRKDAKIEKLDNKLTNTGKVNE